MAEVIARTLISGSEVALIAVGMTIVFGVSRFANVAQVEFATLGAYGALLASSVIGGGVVLDSVVSILVVGVLAVALYHLLFVRLLKRNAATAMIGSLALSIAIRAVIQTITGPDPKSLKLPLERGKDIAGALVTPREIWIVVIGAAVLALLLLVLRFTPLGRSIRAVSTNRDLAQATGIDVRRVTDIVWFIGGCLGGLAGVLLAIDTQISLEMGFSLLLPVFAAALLGGFGSVGGAIAAAYLLVFVENLALHIDFGKLVGSTSSYLIPAYEPAVGFVILILILLVRPQGIFGRTVRRA
jgi:branched-subunit amino acid ABC-type transport system permease component